MKEAGDRGIVPDFVANAPTLDNGEEWYLMAFVELGTCRSFVGMSGEPMSIPWTVKQSFCAEYDIHGDERIRFEQIINRVDNWFINRKPRDGNGSKGTVPEDEASKTTVAKKS